MSLLSLVATALCVWPFLWVEREPSERWAWSQASTLVRAIAEYQSENDGACPSIDQLVDAKYLPKAPVDPWGRALRFRCAGVRDPDVPEAWSVGRDGRDEGGCGDDVPSWIAKDQIGLVVVAGCATSR